jgi:hypothetical protein
MKKQLFAGIIAMIAAFAAIVVIPFYHIFGAAVIILAAVAMGALSFI